MSITRTGHFMLWAWS